MEKTFEELLEKIKPTQMIKSADKGWFAYRDTPGPEGEMKSEKAYGETLTQALLNL